MYTKNLMLAVRKSGTGYNKVVARLVSGTKNLKRGEVPIRLKLKIPDEVLNGTVTEFTIPVPAPPDITLTPDDETP